LFTGLVLLFFLHDLRSTLIVALAMPTSIISTFLALQVAGFSVNMMTLMGLSSSVGVLVANSVVVLENIFRHMEMGHKRRVAADKGTAETAVAVIASTLTNIVVFLPLGMMNTIAGQMLREFSLTVVFATLFSLLVSFTVTPMLASLILPEKKKKGKLGEAMEAMFHRWERRYAFFLEKILHRKWRSAVVVFAAFALFIASFGIARTLGFEFMVTVDEGNLSVKFELPEGYSLEETAAVYEEVEQRLVQYPEVKQLLSTLGSQGETDKATNLAGIDVKLVDNDERTRSSEEIANLFIQDLANIPNAKFKVSVLSSMVGGGRSAIEFYLMGQDIDQLEKLSTDLLERSKTIPGLINLDKSSRAGKPELTLIPKRKEMAELGISVYDLALTLRAAVEGIVATTYSENGEEYDVRITLDDESTNSPDKIKNLPLVTPRGVFRLSQLADVQYTQSSTKILHYDKAKVIEFTGDVALGFVQGNIVNSLKKLQEETDLPNGYQFTWGGNSEMMEENNREMGKAFLIAMILTYLLLAAILESFTKPILILMTLPLALIGVFTALYLTGQSLNLVSMLAIIMLLGIVVNAAILLLDYTQQLRHHGKTTREALLEACPTKLKPIIMSSIAIILGMMPMALGWGSAGAEMRQALGIVSIGGLVVATILTLLIIPAFFYLTTKEHAKLEDNV